MSQNISAARDSTSSPSHNDSKRNILHPPQPYFATSTSTTAPIVSTNTSFTSQRSEASVPPTIVGSPAARPRERALDVSTILNPSPQRRTRIAPYDASRRPSLANLNSPASPPGFLGRRGPDPSRPPSPIEVDLRRAPSVPLPGPGPIRRHARNSLPGVLSVQEHSFPIMSPPRGSPAFRPAGLMGAPSTPPAPPQLHHPPPVPPPSLQQQITSSAGQTRFSSSSGDAYTYAPSSAPASTYHAAATAAPPYSGGHQRTMPDQGDQMHQGHYGMGLGSQHGSGHVMVNTPDGAMVAPLDITSGSMAQHEKRRKNASASSRFRKRKKEKEAENNRRMEELEQNLKRAEEERDRYRQERDYYRQLIVHAQQQGGQLPPLPAGLFENTAPGNTGRDDGQRVGGDAGVGAGMALGRAETRELVGMGLPVPEGMGIGGGQSPHTGNFGGSQSELQQQQHHNVPLHQQQPPAHPEPQPPPSRGRGRGRSRSRGSRGREF